jgi:hypothetical protein
MLLKSHQHLFVQVEEEKENFFSEVSVTMEVLSALFYPGRKKEKA